MSLIDLLNTEYSFELFATHISFKMRTVLFLILCLCLRLVISAVRAFRKVPTFERNMPIKIVISETIRYTVLDLIGSAFALILLACSTAVHILTIRKQFVEMPLIFTLLSNIGVSSITCIYYEMLNQNSTIIENKCSREDKYVYLDPNMSNEQKTKYFYYEIQLVRCHLLILYALVPYILKLIFDELAKKHKILEEPYKNYNEGYVQGYREGCYDTRKTINSDDEY